MKLAAECTGSLAAAAEAEEVPSSAVDTRQASIVVLQHYIRWLVAVGNQLDTLEGMSKDCIILVRKEQASQVYHSPEEVPDTDCCFVDPLLFYYYNIACCLSLNLGF